MTNTEMAVNALGLCLLTVGFGVMLGALVQDLMDIKRSEQTVPTDEISRALQQYLTTGKKKAAWYTFWYTALLGVAVIVEAGVLYYYGAFGKMATMVMADPLLWAVVSGLIVFLAPLVVGKSIRFIQKRRNPSSPLPRWARILNCISDIGFVIFMGTMVMAAVIHSF